MNIWEHLYDGWQIYEWELIIDDWFFVFAMVLLLIELIRLAVRRDLGWNTIGDVVANFATLLLHLVVIAVSAGAYLGAMYLIYPDYSLTMLPNNGFTIAACILLADLAYYWEHRVAHSIGIGWATHTVHHSSPYYNISVAYRHGPLDAVFGLPFHLPIVLMGFDPMVVLFSATMVQLYQTALHTEMVGKLPRMIEAVLNTPSHHRVHHGSNPQYIDKNYAGILIIWDKMFGSFEQENEKVVYGVVPAINSVNPLVVYLHGFGRLAKTIAAEPSFANKLKYLIKPPGWTPAVKEESS